MNKKGINRKIKDTVFTALFKIPKYKLMLYKALNPKEKDIIETDIKTITLKTILTSGLYNDLGLLVKNKIIFLMETQSTWSINIIVRLFIYLSDTYKKYFKENNSNLYGTKKINIPIPELYVLYIGKEKIKKKEISLNEEYFGGKGPIDLKVKIITDRSKNDILKEYIEFANRCNEFRRKKQKPTEKEIISFINKCIKDNILREFLEEHKEEVMSIETMLFDQDYVSEMYDREVFEEGKAAGMQQGEAKGKAEGIQQGIQQGINVIKSLVKEGLISKEEGKRRIALLK